MKKKTRNTTVFNGSKYERYEDSNGASFWAPAPKDELQWEVEPVSTWAGAKISYRQWKTFLKYGEICCRDENSECMATIMARDENGTTSASIELWAFPQFCCTGLTVKENPNDPKYLQKMEWFRSEGFYPYGTIHTHASIGAGQSGVDRDDEKMFEGVHITLGHLNSCLYDVHSRFVAKVLIEGAKTPTYLQQAVKWYQFVELPPIFSKDICSTPEMMYRVEDAIQKCLLWQASDEEYNKELLDEWLALRSKQQVSEWYNSRGGGQYGQYGMNADIGPGLEHHSSGVFPSNTYTMSGKPNSNLGGVKLSGKVANKKWKGRSSKQFSMNSIENFAIFSSPMLEGCQLVEELQEDVADPNAQNISMKGRVYDICLSSAASLIADRLSSCLATDEMIETIRSKMTNRFAKCILGHEIPETYICSYDSALAVLSMMSIVGFSADRMLEDNVSGFFGVILSDILAGIILDGAGIIKEVPEDMSEDGYEQLGMYVGGDEANVFVDSAAAKLVPTKEFSEAMKRFRDSFMSERCGDETLPGICGNFVEIGQAFKWISLSEPFVSVNDEVVNLPFFSGDENYSQPNEEADQDAVCIASVVDYIIGTKAP